jgi:hypothetical protein
MCAVCYQELLFVCLFVFSILGFELAFAKYILYHLMPLVHFAMVILEIESHKLFVWGDFEP